MDYYRVYSFHHFFADGDRVIPLNSAQASNDFLPSDEDLFRAQISETHHRVYAASPHQDGRMPPQTIAPQVMTTSKGSGNATERADLAKAFHDARRARDKFFPSDLFADPAWDILLILYWASYMQLRMSVSSVCVAAAVPQTTALRWVGSLQGLGLVQRESHPTDRRVNWLGLSDEGQAKLDHYFDGVVAKQASRRLRNPMATCSSN
jgi:DNA-binding MarR family transcriptional regulator